MKPNLKDVSKRIKYIRKKLDMTMEQFGYHLGNSPKSTIATWESGRNIPSQKKLTLIADIGETTIDWIKWGTLEEYITSYLIDSGYELYIKDFPDTSHIIFEDIQEKYSETFSLDKDYELLNPIIKNIFTKYYLDKVKSNEEPQVLESKRQKVVELMYKLNESELDELLNILRQLILLSK
ncbi:helix-turn-helix domain-containing protein [Enterococcus cecorum]|uniref:helix-turn-helix domain-containing protein n=1 Tax=Enterococcus cecorum TaxID=44008 RepID=UPI0009B95801|nr:helix-turn-helix transcriptional regulator [Enterococcus cecorum]